MEEFGAGSVQQTTVAPAVKKSGKGALVAAVIFGLIAIGLGVWLAIILLNPAKKDDKSSASNDEESTAAMIRNDDTIREMVKKVATVWGNASDYKIYAYEYDTENAILAISESVQTAVGHSYGFSTDYFGDSEVVENRIKSSHSMAEKKITELVAEYGLSKSSAPRNFGYMGMINPVIYSSDEIFCYSYDGSGYFRFYCADTTWVDEDTKNLNLALAKAHNNKEKDYQLGFIDAKALDIKKNGAGTYELVSAGISNAQAMFYRKVGDNDWKFFMSLQQGPFCENFNTSELKEAYEGEYCMDKDGEGSKVTR